MKAKLGPAVLILALALGVWGWLGPAPAEAASVKSVYSGLVAINSSSSTATATFTPAVSSLSNAFVVCQQKSNNSNPRQAATCELTATNTVTMKLGANSLTTSVSWYVVEFEAGNVNVQRNSFAWGTSATTSDVTITAVDSTKSFTLTAYRTLAVTSTNTADEDYATTTELQNGTSTSPLASRLHFARGEAANDGTVVWQVVTMDGATVYRNSTSIGSGSTSTTQQISGSTTVDTAKTFLLMTVRGAAAINGIDDQWMTIGRITNSTQLTFNRGSSTNSATVAWEVVSLNDGTVVQHQEVLNSTSTTTLTNFTLSPAVTLAQAVPFLNTSVVAGTVGDWDDAMWATQFTNTTQLQLTRTATGSTNFSVSWFVANFFKCTNPSDISYVTAKVDSTTPTQVTLSFPSSPVIVLRKTGSAFSSSTEYPVSGNTYAVGTGTGPGGTTDVVYNSTSAATSTTDTGRTAGTKYYYKVVARSSSTTSAACFAPGVVGNSEVSITPGQTSVAWSYSLSGGPMLTPGIAGTGKVYPSSNAGRIVSLETASGVTGGTENWSSVATATGSGIQGWLTSVPSTTSWIKSFQTGQIAPGQAVQMNKCGATATQQVDITISAVNLTNSILFFTVGVDSHDGDNGMVRGQLTSTTNVRFFRQDCNSSTADVNIRWTVVEFNGGVSVQRSTWAATSVTNASNVTITAVDLTKSFVVVSCSTAGLPGSDSTFDSNNYIRARLTTSTNLEILHGSATDTDKCEWQVVQYPGASVQRGSGTLASGVSSSGAITLTTSVDTTKSFVQVTWKTDGAGTGVNFLRAQLTGGGASVTIDRATTGTTIDYAWEVVSFDDGTSVQGGNLSFLSSDLTKTVGLTSVNTTQSVAFLSANQWGGSHAYTADDRVSPGWFRATVTNATTLTLERFDVSTGGVAADAAWFVVQFPQTVETVIAADGTGRVYAVNAATGAKPWTENTTAGWNIQAGVAVQVSGYSNSAFTTQYGANTDIIFAATMNGSTTNRLYAIKATDGTTAWSFNGTVESGTRVSDITGMPYVDYNRNRVYVASKQTTSGRSLFVINGLSGASVACNSTNCDFATLGTLGSSPTLNYTGPTPGTTLYVGNSTPDATANLYALTTSDTTPPLTAKWTFPLGAGNGYVKGFVWEDYTTAGRLYFTTTTGKVMCVQDNGGSAAACVSPWVVGTTVTGASTPLLLNKLFVGSSDGKVHQINLTTGADEKQFPASTTLDGTTVGDVSTETGNEIFVGTNDAKIYKINLSSGALP